VDLEASAHALGAVPGCCIHVRRKPFLSVARQKGDTVGERHACSPLGTGLSYPPPNARGVVGGPVRPAPLSGEYPPRSTALCSEPKVISSPHALYSVGVRQPVGTGDCPVLSCPVLSCPVLSCPVLSCPVLSCPLQDRLSHTGTTFLSSYFLRSSPGDGQERHSPVGRDRKAVPYRGRATILLRRKGLYRKVLARSRDDGPQNTSPVFRCPLGAVHGNMLRVPLGRQSLGCPDKGTHAQGKSPLVGKPD